MNHAVNLWVCRKHLVHSRLIGNVYLVKGWSLSAEELDAIEGDLGGVVQGVDDDDVVVILEEGKGGERANVASATVKRRWSAICLML